mmetsp:Transcript_62690/g.148477  ORF Transcript_62690/g.148477 Transcript_62690/m.148477 type:complete len:200 (+) Transcript_62690:303-902(+)
MGCWTTESLRRMNWSFSLFEENGDGNDFEHRLQLNTLLRGELVRSALGLEGVVQNKCLGEGELVQLQPKKSCQGATGTDVVGLVRLDETSQSACLSLQRLDASETDGQICELICPWPLQMLKAVQESTQVVRFLLGRCRGWRRASEPGGILLHLACHSCEGAGRRALPSGAVSADDLAVSIKGHGAGSQLFPESPCCFV